MATYAQPALHHDELQVGCLFRRLYPCARGGALDAYLVCAADPKLSELPLSDFPGGGGLDVQRDPAYRAPVEDDRRSRGCGPTSSTGRSTTCAVRFSGRRCLRSLSERRMQPRRQAIRLLSKASRKVYRDLLDAYFGPDFAHRPRAGTRGPTNPAFLQRVLRLQVCHWNLRRRGTGRAGPREWRCYAISELPSQRRKPVSHRNARGGWSGHDFSSSRGGCAPAL